MEHTKTLGGRIQAFRKAAGLSQEALGEQLGVSRQAVSRWESDAAVPELEKLIPPPKIRVHPARMQRRAKTRIRRRKPRLLSTS